METLIQFTERFGNMLSKLLLTVLYYLVLGPAALVYRAVADPLRLTRPKNGSNWIPWTGTNETLQRARRQD